MDELGKIKRVVEKVAPVTEVLLVLDATTGQNGVVQARVFTEVVDVTGVVLTKLDGTAKGGIVVSVQRELGIPVKLVGLGEGPDDLAPFDPREFAEALVGGAD
jgi:fused signal recognition particle receptor